MNYKLVFIYFILLILTVKAHALTASEALERDLLPAVKTFQKDIQLFHYFAAPTDDSSTDPSAPKKLHPILNAKDSRDSWINYLMQAQAGAFWDLNNHNITLSNAGLGMYFALDPNSSKEFGDSDVEINVKEGLRMISVSKTIPLKKDTLNLLLQEGIINQNQIAVSSETLGLFNGFSASTLKNMVREENAGFRKAVQDIFARNQIQFIEYTYKSHLAGFCKVANQSALVFTGLPPSTDASVSNGSSNNNEVLATIDPSFQNTLFMSSYEVQNYSPEEIKEVDLFNRFKDVLAQIRIKGTGLAAKKIIHDNLSEDEINELAAKSYQCVRRY
ncbi:MAG: hypothetical protein ACXVAX_03550 [Pseudobdellovibrio sp.]